MYNLCSQDKTNKPASMHYVLTQKTYRSVCVETEIKCGFKNFQKNIYPREVTSNKSNTTLSVLPF